MKRITFKNATAQKIYDDYFKRANRCISMLSANDQLDILMELNSHIYEATHEATAENEIDILVDTLQKLGDPEEILKPAVAYHKAQQAGRTFNPKHIVQALSLNIFNGAAYVIMGVVYLLILASGSLIVLKLLYPAHTGLFIGSNSFSTTGIFTGSGRFFFGYSPQPLVGVSEVLGNWFILTVIGLMLLFYFLNTLLFRLVKKRWLFYQYVYSNSMYSALLHLYYFKGKNPSPIVLTAGFYAANTVKTLTGLLII